MRTLAAARSGPSFAAQGDPGEEAGEEPSAAPLETEPLAVFANPDLDAVITSYFRDDEWEEQPAKPPEAGPRKPVE